MKKIMSMIVVIVMCLSLLVGCDMSDSNDSTQATQTEVLQKQSQTKLGLPNIKNFYEKATLKDIMEACDNSKLITYTYLKNDMTGKFTYLGESMGYGTPSGTEYTSPEKLADTGYHDSSILPQADPNGLYKAQGVSATWIMLIDPITKVAKPVYVESDITVSPFKLTRTLCDTTSLPSNY